MGEVMREIGTNIFFMFYVKSIGKLKMERKLLTFEMAGKSDTYFE